MRSNIQTIHLILNRGLQLIHLSFYQTIGKDKPTTSEEGDLSTTACKTFVGK